MQNDTVRSWIERDGHKVKRVEIEIGNNKNKKGRLFKLLLVVVAILTVFLSVATAFASVDMTPYKNTKYLVNWDTYVFPNISSLKSKVVKDYLDYQSMDDWKTFDENTKKNFDSLYNTAKKSQSYYKAVVKTKSSQGKLYYTGFSKKKLTNLRNSLIKMKTLYSDMEKKLVVNDVQYTGYYKNQVSSISEVLKYFTTTGINAVSSISTEYNNNIPKSYFKISYKTVNMCEDEEVEAYNSLYTQLVHGCVTVTYGKEDNTKYNNTVVSTGTGKGYVIYPMSLVGRVKYVKVTYVVKSNE